MEQVRGSTIKLERSSTHSTSKTIDVDNSLVSTRAQNVIVMWNRIFFQLNKYLDHLFDQVKSKYEITTALIQISLVFVEFFKADSNDLTY